LSLLEGEEAKQVEQESHHRAEILSRSARQINDLPAGRGFRQVPASRTTPSHIWGVGRERLEQLRLGGRELKQATRGAKARGILTVPVVLMTAAAVR